MAGRVAGGRHSRLPAANTALPTRAHAELPHPKGDLYSVIEFWNEVAPKDEALVEDDRRWTWSDLADRVSRLAAALAEDGMRSGDRFASLDKNSTTTVEATLAAARNGYAHVIVNWRLAPDELAYILADAQAGVLFVGAEFVPQLEEIRSRLPELTKVVVVGGDADEYEHYLASAQPVQRTHQPAPDDCVLQLYTSGTTGFPKGAMLTHRSLEAHCITAVEAFHLTRDSVNMVAMPLCHVGGSSWSLLSIYTGARTVIVRAVVPADVLEQIGRERVTHAFFVPTIFEYLLAAPELDSADLSSLRCLVYGGAPMPPPLMRRCLDRFRQDFYQAYGMTEASGAVCVLEPAAHRDPDRTHLLASAGRPVKGVQVKVVNPVTEQEVRTGQTGEFWIRSDQVMVGYWRKPDADGDSFHDGWLHTGDAGYQDEAGYLFVRGRVKEMIISGGENIYPVEVERVLAQHPAVAEACVIGVPDPTYGEAVKAVVTTAPDAVLDEGKLIAFCREHLAAYKCPKSVDVVRELPRTATGKVLKRELRRPYWTND
ncbi:MULTISPECIES: long-chain-fatty-acid--CoA ligase [Streptomyces]|uniref:long-chain-fatty-acid--CoA ligase n=1 Tax=Streptomyces TaxID=1883 RepID=UPI000996B2AF|nr:MULTISPECIES: long-chain-fatty-acid--CoA ligase [Streptomyces]